MVRRPVQADDWERQPMPEQHQRLPLDLLYSPEQFEEIRMGLYPLEMEDKWFVYFEEPWLYFHRSWTGMLLYQVRFEPAEGGRRAVELLVNGDRQSYQPPPDKDETKAIKRLIWLLLAHHGQGAAPQTGRQEPRTGERQALEAWSESGRASIGLGLRPGYDPYRLGTSTMYVVPKRRPSDRYAGALLALACGDALGAPAEFLSQEELEARHGQLTLMVGGGSCNWAPGEWTDDTGMTLCVAEGILENPDDPVTAIGERFLEWMKTTKDVGSTIRSALQGFRGDWADASRNTSAALDNRAAGNGSLMRTLPVALAYPDRDQMLTASARISAMTHWDPQAELACAIYCLWIRGVLRGLSVPEAWSAALDESREVEAEGRRAADTSGPRPVPPHFWERLTAAPNARAENLQPINNYAGYVVDCLEAVVWCCHRHTGSDETIIEAVNLAGEADTIAAIAGGIMGTANGLEGLRSGWLEALFERDRIDELGRKLARLRHQIVYSKPGLPTFTGFLASPGLFAGRNPLTDMDIEHLMARGIGVIIDLREDHEWAEPGRYGSEAVAAEPWSDLRRCHVPVRDGEAPGPDDLDRVWEILRQDARKASGDVYVHCRAGRERTGAILVAYVARSEGISFDKALRRLQEGGCPIHLLPDQETAVRRWLEEQSASP
jgi:ADP-ribosyl-[dinitrogen reductase] hydrolase